MRYTGRSNAKNVFSRQYRSQPSRYSRESCIALVSETEKRAVNSDDVHLATSVQLQRMYRAAPLIDAFPEIQRATPPPHTRVVYHHRRRHYCVTDDADQPPKPAVYWFNGSPTRGILLSRPHRRRPTAILSLNSTAAVSSWHPRI